MIMNREKRISKEKLKEGITVSLKKCTKHIDGAETLINNDFLDDAIALIEFAIEDFGRAVYLRERLQTDLETIEKSLETDHWLKYNKAFSVLPLELKTIWENTISNFPKGHFPTNYFPKGHFPIMKGTISPSTRLEAIFPYYDDKTQTWRSGINADREMLKTIVEKLRENVKAFLL